MVGITKTGNKQPRNDLIFYGCLSEYSFESIVKRSPVDTFYDDWQDDLLMP